MDTKIENKTIIKRKHIAWIIGGIAVSLLAGWLLFGNHAPTLRVDKRTLNIETTQQGLFNDYARVNGVVQPITIVQLTPLESGIVEEKIVEEGAKVKKGDVIIRLSNTQLNIQILESEASLAEKENFLRNTRVQMEQERLSLRRERLTLDMEVGRKRRKYEQSEALYKDNMLAKEDFIQAKEDYVLAHRNAELVVERQKQDSIFRAIQVDNMESNLQSMRRNMDLVRKRIDNLNIKSPIDGELGMLDIVLGQNVQTGMKIGQINDLTDYKIEAMIDEHYIDRVREGLKAQFERSGEFFELEVRKVFPEVRGGKFRTWFYFTSTRPENIRTGQTYYINLELGQPTESVIIPRGAFYQMTGGAWIFVVDGDRAMRRPVKIGRQNPQYYEVLEGLRPGEKVVVSSYETFGKNEVLVLK